MKSSMRKCGLVVLLILLSVTARGAEPEPLLAIFTYGAWGARADGPKFVVYDDGTVVWQAIPFDANLPFRSIQVTDAQRVVTDSMGDALRTSHASYRLSAATDQPMTTIWTPTRRATIYGHWRHPLQLDDGSGRSPWTNRIEKLNESEQRMRNSLSKSLRAGLEDDDLWRKRTGKPWLPPRIEVRFWDYSYPPDHSIDWPKTWPGPAAGDQRNKEFSIYLSSSQLPALRSFLSSRPERGAILIDGRKMAASYRLALPSESRWRN